MTKSRSEGREDRVSRGTLPGGVVRRRGKAPVIPDYTEARVSAGPLPRRRRSNIATPPKSQYPAVLQVLEQLSSSLLICGFRSVYAALTLLGFSHEQVHSWFRSPESPKQPKMWQVQALAQLCGMQVVLVPIRDLDKVAVLVDTYLREVARGEIAPHAPEVHAHPVEKEMRAKIEARLERLRTLAGDVVDNGRRGAQQE